MMVGNAHQPQSVRAPMRCTPLPIQHFSTAMFDTTSFKGPLGRPVSHHQTHISVLTHHRNLQSKVLRATTFINSPLTGRQIDVEYTVEDHEGVPTAFVTITLPTAAASVGHNYAHAGLASVRSEVEVSAALVRVTLAALGFTLDEIGRFMKGARCQHLELTWHTSTASRRARLSLQNRTKQHFDALLSIKGRHDIQISDVDYKEGNGSPGLLVTLKSGDRFRQYGKADQIRSRKRRDRSDAWMSTDTRQYRQSILDAIEHHTRNEVIACAETLRDLGLEHPRSWNEASLKRLIGHVWKEAGLRPQQPDNNRELSPEVEETWRKYLDGDDLRESLSDHTFGRHRAIIKEVKGEDQDIAIPRKSRAVRPASLGRQLCYERHWEPSGQLRQAVLCEETAPAILEELERGLAFIQDGIVPPFEDSAERAKWVYRWQEFVARERGRIHEAR